MTTGDVEMLVILSSEEEEEEEEEFLSAHVFLLQQVFFETELNVVNTGGKMREIRLRLSNVDITIIMMEAASQWEPKQWNTQIKLKDTTLTTLDCVEPERVERERERDTERDREGEI